MDKKSDKTYIVKIIDSRPYLALSVILVFAFVLRLLFINSREIFYDDGFSFWLSINSFGDIVKGTVADTMPPLYYFLLHFWSDISYQLWFLRLLNVLLSLVLLFFIYKLTSAWFGKKQGLISVLLTAILPFQIYHAQELRMYILLCVGQIGYIYFVYRLVSQDDNRVRNVSLSLFFGFIAMYSHNLVIFGLITVNLFFFLEKNFKTVKKLAVVQIALLVGFIPWLVYLPQQISKIQTAFWTPKPGLLEIVQAVLSLFSFLPMPLLWVMVVAVLIFQTFALVLYWTVKNANKKRLILVGLIFLPGLFLFLISYLMRPVFVPRALISSSILFIVLVSDFVVNNWHNQIGKFVLFSLVISAGVGLPYFYQFESFPRSSFRSATQYLKTTVDQGALILHDNKLSFFPMHFYAPDLAQSYLADEPGSHNDTLALPSQEVMGLLAEKDINSINLDQDVYFVVFDKAIQEYEVQGLSHPGLMRLKEGHQIFKIEQFGDLYVYYFKVKT
ncbi:MAG: hypothetical protein CL609_19110 [Anaerolineaceae bacterium]|nr:hypothetical protein [Anaerolineaceae bacterium]